MLKNHKSVPYDFIAFLKKISTRQPRCTGSRLDVTTVSVAVNVADPRPLRPAQGVRVSPGWIFEKVENVDILFCNFSQSPVCMGIPSEGVDAFTKWLMRSSCMGWIGWMGWVGWVGWMGWMGWWVLGWWVLRSWWVLCCWWVLRSWWVLRCVVMSSLTFVGYCFLGIALGCCKSDRGNDEDKGENSFCSHSSFEMLPWRRCWSVCFSAGLVSILYPIQPKTWDGEAG